jgi:hypothetical protein
MTEKLGVNIQDFPVFFETGLWRGETYREIVPKDHVKKYVNIEIKKYFIDIIKHKTDPKHLEKSIFINGDTMIKIGTAISQHSINQKTIFFLDAHFSGGDTEKGIKYNPLMEELQIINDLQAEECVIIIDDTRLLNNSKAHYGGMNEISICNILKDRSINHLFSSSVLHPKDRLIFHLKPLTNLC